MEIKELSFQYKNSPPIIKGLSTSFAEGKITTIIGPNGSGKSTLLGLMARNYTPNAGQIMIDGRELQSLKGKELARLIAVVHQQNDAPYDLTVERLVSYGRMPYRAMFSQETDEDRQAIAWALECTKLTEFRSRRLNELSGGQKQRAWIAMALAQKTSVLFLDEPTTFLDIYYQIELLDLVKELNEVHGLTIVMVLHDVNQAVRYSDHIKVVKDGELIAEGEPEVVMTSELMKTVYDVQAIVRKDEEVGMYIVPIATQA